ncbi:saccharopine dehydrogenase-like oxidoreductase [Brevipalpus obovatus]|uniref:saccharopine dehydrogenase-like oxidoreductase n=1 Tax=Brevipalpus obovatus TaxID=246614 RepID=UPI003D9DDEEB
MGDREFELTIFGATGYTGGYVLRNLIAWQNIEKRKRTFAIAGRDEGKLVNLIAETINPNGQSDGQPIGVIAADVHDDESIAAMCKRSKIILNACGPYIKFGEPVVKACIQHGTHMVDISGETLYIEEMMVKYHEQAKEAGVYIVSACGWDSIPSEMGLMFLRDQFGPNGMHSAEGFVKMNLNTMGTSYRTTVNHGTLDSLAEMVANFSKIEPMRKRLYSSLFKKNQPASIRQLRKFYHPWKMNGKGWCAPFISENIGLADISSRWIYETEDEQPTQYFEYMTFPYFIMSLIFMIFGAYLFLMCWFSRTRKLITNYPGCFTFGFFSKVGPTRKQLQNMSFEIEIVAKGWKSFAGTKNQTKTPDRILTCIITGPDPGYETTSRCMIQSALSIADEAYRMPFTGGVLSPGFAFRRTSIRERLSRHDVKFSILSEKDPEFH